MPESGPPPAADLLLFRSMRTDPHGLPLVAPSARGLGARTDREPDAFHRDIERDPTTGLVGPGTGGLSVAPGHPGHLPRHRRPSALGGEGDDPVFAIPVLALGPDLTYRPDPAHPTRHGFIEPSRSMPLDEYQAALAATRAGWVVYDR